ncbi:MAG: MFS transporter [Gemmatimonadaceae bacterium]|nr:MFS transporter [Gemmatimonadaceae bacterium]
MKVPHAPLEGAVAAPVRASRYGNPFAPLVTAPNFRRFWIGQTVSLVGSWMQSMAAGWLALELSGSAFIVGLVASVGALPIVVLSFQAGVIADRVDRLRLLRWAQAGLLVQAALLWGLTATGRLTVPLLIGLAAIAGAINAFEVPARQSLIIKLVGPRDLQGAIALNSSGFNLARVVGPAIGAVVIGRLGIAWCFALNALSFVAVLIGLFRIRLDGGAIQSETGKPGGVIDGLRYLWERRVLRALVGLTTVFAVFCAPFLALMPVVARERLGLGAGGYGLLLTAVGVGGLAAALFLAARARSVRRGRLLTFAAIAFPTLLVAFATVRAAWAACLVLLGVGATMIWCNALSNGLLQSNVADAYRGRAMAVQSLAVMGLAQVAGAFAAGVLAEWVGVAWAIGGTAVAALAFAVVLLWRVPEVRRL